MRLSDEVLELIAQRLKIMSEANRLKILQILKEGEMSVGEIAESTGMKHGTASANLVALQRGGLVNSRREGTKMLYRISSDMVFRICDVVCESLKDEFEQLDEMKRSMGM